MAKLPVLGRFHAPQSMQQLTKGRGWNSELTGFLLPFARQDFVYFEDDFLSDTMDPIFWNLDTDAGSTAFAQGSLECGNIRGVTQNTSGDNIGVHFSYPMFDAARAPGCEVRWKVVTYTAAQLLFEFGLWDAPSDGTLQVVTDVDTPATGNGVTDCLLIHMDGSQTFKTFALVSDGTTPACAKTAFPTTLIPVADTWMRMLVQCGSGGGIGAIRGETAVTTGGQGWTQVGISTGPTTGYLMQAAFMVGTLANTARTVDIDYFRVWSERSPNA